MKHNWNAKVKEWAVPVLVPSLLLGAWWSQTAENNREAVTRLEIQCRIEEQNVSQLEALKEIARELGLPGRFDNPPRSQECMELALERP